MKSPHYTSATSIAEACAILAREPGRVSILAGGTDLLLEWRRRPDKVPEVILDLSRIAELRGIDEANGGLVVGPLATHAELLGSESLQRFAPLLAVAAGTVGSPQIRSRGTIGGNLMNAAACADTVPPLVALGALVTLQSASGSRRMKLADLFVKPYQTRARPDELLTGIHFPKLSDRARSTFLKLGRRNALAISRLSVAAILEFDSAGAITEARIVPGAAFPTWQRVTVAEAMLAGEKPSAKLFAGAGRKVAEEMVKETGRRWSTEYKEPVLAVLVRRALEQCADRGPQPAWPRSGRPTKAHAKKSSSAQTDRPQPAVGTIAATINGRLLTFPVSGHQALLDLLRNQLGFTGTKCGCEIGECGACTVLIDGEPVNSCLVLAAQIDGREVLTVEGLGNQSQLHPLQASFLDHDAAHCGFCTPGMLMSAKALLDWNPHPSEREIRTAISGNLCRCTGYQQIVTAIAKAAGK